MFCWLLILIWFLISDMEIYLLIVLVVALSVSVLFVGFSYEFSLVLSVYRIESIFGIYTA